MTVDRWQLGAVSGDFELAGAAQVDWLLASPSAPGAFRWEEMLALGHYDWMRPDAPPRALPAVAAAGRRDQSAIDGR